MANRNRIIGGMLVSELAASTEEVSNMIPLLYIGTRSPGAFSGSSSHFRLERLPTARTLFIDDLLY